MKMWESSSSTTDGQARARCILVFLALGSILASSCKDAPADRSSPTGALAYYLDAWERGDYETMFKALARKVRDKVAQVYRNYERAYQLSAKCPRKLSELRERLSFVAQTKGPAELYARYLVDAPPFPASSILASLALKPRKIEKGRFGMVRVRTVGGDVFLLAKGGDGLYYYVPREKLQQRLNEEFFASSGILQHVELVVRSCH